MSAKLDINYDFGGKTALVTGGTSGIGPGFVLGRILNVDGGLTASF